MNIMPERVPRPEYVTYIMSDAKYVLIQSAHL